MKLDKICLFILACVISASCADLNYTEENTRDEDWTYEYYGEGIKNMVFDVYAQVYNREFESNSATFLAGATDEAVYALETGAVNGYVNGGWSPANPFSSTWDKAYTAISEIHMYLEKIHKTDLSDWQYNPEYQTWIQQMELFPYELRFLRAYFYFELFKTYGDVPLVTTTLTNAQANNVTRTPAAEIVKFIVDELDEIAPHLPLSYATEVGAEFGRANRIAAYALKARTLLYAASPLHNPTNDVKKWEAAAAAANELITNTDLSYSLASDYGSYFVGGNSVASSETIYAVRRAQSNSMEVNNYPIATQGGKSGATPTHNLVAAYEYIGTPDPTNPYANRDPRLAASIVTNGSTWNGRTIDQAAGGSDDMARANASRTGYYLKKFLTDNLNLTQGQNAQHNWVAYRWAEVLLNYAEAMNEAYGPDAVPAGYLMSARQALQKVRDRASVNLPKVTASDKESFREVVKHERRIELAFEDHRYWDLLRWKDAMDVLNRPVLGVKITKNGEGWNYEVTEVATRTFYERNYYLPFLRSEIENSNNTLEQNPNY